MHPCIRLVREELPLRRATETIGATVYRVDKGKYEYIEFPRRLKIYRMKDGKPTAASDRAYARVMKIILRGRYAV